MRSNGLAGERTDGLVFFWFLNDECDPKRLRVQLDAFAAAGITTLALHPRDGLLFPYGSDDWFRLVRSLALECRRRGLTVWLYDEDPYPSGNAGGLLAAGHPEFAACQIERFQADPAEVEKNGLFVFPGGRLLWAGLQPPPGDSGRPRDLTARVGAIRRHWDVALHWDSRWYYPAMPTVPCPRAATQHMEYALRAPAIPAGWRLTAFVARQIRNSRWGTLVDTLNPAATRAFLRSVYDRYAAAVGDLFGATIRALFVDEPKPPSAFAWTPDLFESFRERFGYDLRPRLEHLFRAGEVPAEMNTRLDYRQWIGERFVSAWIAPVSRWCRKHGLALLGHVSPEDDLVQQASRLGNLMPVHKHFSMPGLDLIVPLVGDKRHPMLNIGALLAVSSAQQNRQPGVVSETLGLTTAGTPAPDVARILAWQTVMGVNTIVVHGAFVSQLGLRRHEAPPDFGPNGAYWKAMPEIDRGLRPFWAVTRRARQQAPVAVLWPIRAFQAEGTAFEPRDIGPRKAFHRLVNACLERQVGIQIVDEADLPSARFDNGTLRLGRAQYTAVVAPAVPLLEATTIAILLRLERAGFHVVFAGAAPSWQHAPKGVRKTGAAIRKSAASRAAGLDTLPPLLPLDAPRRNCLRLSGWEKRGRTTWLLMNLDSHAQKVRVAREFEIELGPGEIAALRRGRDGWHTPARFAPASVPAARHAEETPALADWAVRWSDRAAWQPLDLPAAVHRLRPVFRAPRELLALSLSGTSALGAAPTAEWLEYRCRLPKDGLPENARLLLEPTAVRGRLAIRLGRRRWNVTLSDTDTRPVSIPIGRRTSAAARAPRYLLFRFERPDPNDGLKVPPRILAS